LAQKRAQCVPLALALARLALVAKASTAWRRAKQARSVRKFALPHIAVADHLLLIHANTSTALHLTLRADTFRGTGKEPAFMRLYMDDLDKPVMARTVASGQSASVAGVLDCSEFMLVLRKVTT